MTDAICSVPGCDRPAARRGWCSMHYLRWYRHGDLGPAEQVGRQRLSNDRLFEQVEKAADGCWLWLGITFNGYGRLTVDGRKWIAHRYVYEQLVGPIPEGLPLDHLCRVRNCVNPDHLEPVTTAENNRRAAAAVRRPDECGNGHQMTPENSYSRPSAPDRIECRTCRRAWSRANRARKEAAARAGARAASPHRVAATISVGVSRA